MVEALNDNNFEEKTAKGLNLIDFWASWCGPCRMQTPIIEEMDAENDGSVDFYTVDVDENQATAQKFGVMSIPTLVISKDGQLMESLIGVHSKEQLEEALDKYK